METTSIKKIYIIKLRAKHKLTEISTNAWRIVKKIMSILILKRMKIISCGRRVYIPR